MGGGRIGGMEIGRRRSFAGGSDPFGTSSGGEDPFAASGAPAGFGGPAPATGPSMASMAPSDGTPMADSVLQELKKLDRTMPSNPGSANREAQFAFLEKKVAFLEAKIGVLSKLIRGLQAKEIELNEKNDLIGKLLALLS